MQLFGFGAKQLDNDPLSQNFMDNVIKGATTQWAATNVQARIAKIMLNNTKLALHQKYKFPASMRTAKIHKNANKFGYNSIDKHQPIVLCPCCDLQINTENVPICYGTTNIKEKQFGMQGQGENFKLSSSVAMFFSFIKMICFYFLVHTIISDSYNIVSSLTAGKQCQLQGDLCQASFFTKSSGLNKKGASDFILVQDILNLIMVLISIPFFIVYRKIQYGIYDQIDADIQTQDDYAIFLQDIPILDFPSSQEYNGKQVHFHYREKLEKEFKSKIQNWLKDWQSFQTSDSNIQRQLWNFRQGKNPLKQCIITSTVLCFDLRNYYKIEDMIENLMYKYQDQVASDNSNTLIQEQYRNQPFEPLTKQIGALNECKFQLGMKYITDNSVLSNLTNFVGSAFVCFQFQHYRQYIMRQVAKDKNFIKFNDSPLYLERASHPRDIFWQNLYKTRFQRRQLYLISAGITIMTLVTAFGVFLLLTTWRGKDTSTGNQQNQSFLQKFFVQILTIVTTLTTLATNTLLYWAINKLTNYQKHATKTNFYFSLILKMLGSQTINTVVMYYLVNRIYRDEFLNSTGLVIQISALIITSAFINILMNLLNTGDIQARLWRFYKYGCLSNEDTVNKFQIHLNKEYQETEFDMAGRYTYYLLQIYTASFYCYISPACIPALIVIFFFMYWTDKINLFYRHSFVRNLNYSLTRYVLKLFQLSIVLFAGGNFVFSLYQTQNHRPTILNIISLSIAIIYAIISFLLPQDIQKKYLGNYETLETFTYEECQKDSKFVSTYWKTNPATFLVLQQDVTGHQHEKTQQKIIYYTPQTEQKTKERNKSVKEIIDNLF